MPKHETEKLIHDMESAGWQFEAAESEKRPTFTKSIPGRGRLRRTMYDWSSVAEYLKKLVAGENPDHVFNDLVSNNTLT